MTVKFKKLHFVCVFKNKFLPLLRNQNLKVMSQKITFAYPVVYQSVTVSSLRKTSAYEGSIIREFRV